MSSIYLYHYTIDDPWYNFHLGKLPGIDLKQHHCNSCSFTHRKRFRMYSELNVHRIRYKIIRIEIIRNAVKYKKKGTPKVIAVIFLKSHKAVMISKDADGKANSMDRDPIASSRAVGTGSVLFAQLYLSQYLKKPQ